MRPPLAWLFAVLAGFTLGAFQSASAQGGESIRPSTASLQRYLEWGLFDSLWIATHTWLGEADSTARAPEIAQVHLLRGVAWLMTRQDTSRAFKDFRQAACLDSKARLDSFYLPATMVRLHDSLISYQGTQGLPCHSLASGPGTQANHGMAKPGFSRDSITEGAGRINPRSPASASSAWKGSAWTLAGMGTLAITWGGYAWVRRAQAYDKQSQAGKAGDKADYLRYGLDVERHNQNRNLAFGFALLTGLGSGYCFYRAHGMVSKTPSSSIWLPLFQAHYARQGRLDKGGLEMAWVF